MVVARHRATLNRPAGSARTPEAWPRAGRPRSSPSFGNPAGGPVGSRHRQQLNGEFTRGAGSQAARSEAALEIPDEPGCADPRAATEPAHALFRPRPYLSTPRKTDSQLS